MKPCCTTSKLLSKCLVILWTAVLLDAQEAHGQCNFSSLSKPVAADTKIRWLTKEQRCEPDLCRGLELGDIPDASGHLPVSLFCSLRMFDSNRLLKQLQGNYIVMFGDSTMEENMYDIIVLLSNMSRNRSLMDSFMLEGVWSDVDVPKTVELPVHGNRDAKMKVTFHASGRNVTISVPSHEILIRFRFTGHHRVKENYNGISTFTEPLWLAEYRCMVENIGPDCAHKYPDFLIVNSGAHDTKKTLNEFAPKMQRLASWLGEVQLKLGTKVIWRGNNALGSLHAYESIARYYIQKEGVQFMDVSTFLTTFKEDLQTGCCTDKATGNGLHVGVIGKYYSNSNRNGTYIYVSSMITQGLLGTMFPETPKAGCSEGKGH